MSELQTIPGVGKKISADLNEIGIHKIEDLKGTNPQGLYEQLCRKQGYQIDKCLLYVMRCAVYYASNKKHNTRLLKWWNWKDQLLSD